MARVADFNINDYVRVKLTPMGIEILKQRHEQLMSFYKKGSIDEFNLRIDAEGYYKTQMWDLMQTFGAHLGLGARLPFETNIILCTEG